MNFSRRKVHLSAQFLAALHLLRLVWILLWKDKTAQGLCMRTPQIWMFHTFLVLSENATRVSFTVSVRNTTIAQVRENVSYPMKRSVWLAMILSVCVVIVQMVIACRSPYAKNAPTAVNYVLNMVVINAHMDLFVLQCARSSCLGRSRMMELHCP